MDIMFWMSVLTIIVLVLLGIAIVQLIFVLHRVRRIVDRLDLLTDIKGLVSFFKRFKK